MFVNVDVVVVVSGVDLVEVGVIIVISALVFDCQWSRCNYCAWVAHCKKMLMSVFNFTLFVRVVMERM